MAMDAPNEKRRGNIFSCWARSLPLAMPYWRGASERHPWHFPNSTEIEVGGSWMDNSFSELLRVTATWTTRNSLRSVDADSMLGILYACALQNGRKVKDSSRRNKIASAWNLLWPARSDPRGQVVIYVRWRGIQSTLRSSILLASW